MPTKTIVVIDESFSINSIDLFDLPVGVHRQQSVCLCDVGLEQDEGGKFPSLFRTCKSISPRCVMLSSGYPVIQSRGIIGLGANSPALWFVTSRSLVVCGLRTPWIGDEYIPGRRSCPNSGEKRSILILWSLWECRNVALTGSQGIPSDSSWVSG